MARLAQLPASCNLKGSVPFRAATVAAVMRRDFSVVAIFTVELSTAKKSNPLLNGLDRVLNHPFFRIPNNIRPH
jgi:hypothetical protein